MNYKKLLSLYGLKWNPFAPNLPSEALIITPRIEHFLWQVESLVMEGGFAAVTGEAGIGKSVVMRLLDKRLSVLQDVVVAELSRPQSGLGDFYRELGNLFGVELRVANKYGGFHALRDKWRSHIETTLFRPVLLIDEAQEMQESVLSELRLLSSMKFDSQIVLAVILSGDGRLLERLRQKELMPLGSRIRSRLPLERYSSEDLLHLLQQSLSLAGAPDLMSPGLMKTLSEHALGNLRCMNNTANELLMLAVKLELKTLDEKLFFDAFPTKPQRKRG